MGEKTEVSVECIRMHNRVCRDRSVGVMVNGCSMRYTREKESEFVSVCVCVCVCV